MWKHMYVHRISFAATYGEISEGHHIHHECGDKACFNPAHLLSVRGEEHNALFHALHLSSCPYGHPYPESLRPPPSRNCAVCHRERERKRKKRMRS